MLELYTVFCHPRECVQMNVKLLSLVFGFLHTLSSVSDQIPYQWNGAFLYSIKNPKLNMYE